MSYPGILGLFNFREPGESCQFGLRPRPPRCASSRQRKALAVQDSCASSVPRCPSLVPIGTPSAKTPAPRQSVVIRFPGEPVATSADASADAAPERHSPATHPTGKYAAKGTSTALPPVPGPSADGGASWPAQSAETQ